MGMYLMRQIGTRGVYADPILPDFMVFLNWKELPVYWYGFQHFSYAALMVVLVLGLLAFIFGWFAFRSRVSGVYLSIITQALTYALMLGFFRNNFGFGGNNGLTDFKDILGFDVRSEATRAALFSISCVTLMIGFLVCRAIVTSKFGKVLIAIATPKRARDFSATAWKSYKLFVFTLSAGMAGMAGALYVPQVGIINPSDSPPVTPSRPSSGWRSAAGARSPARCSAPSSSITPRPISPRACSLRIGCSCSAACSSA